MSTYVKSTEEEEDKKVFALHVLIWCLMGALLICLIAGVIKTPTGSDTSTSDNSSTVQQVTE